MFIGRVDTLQLPQPAKALATSPDSRLVFLSRAGDDVFVLEENDEWENYSLPERISGAQRLLYFDELLYVLRGRKLMLYDLRRAVGGTLANDVDDAALTTTGELWVLSDFTLRRLSPLGSILEERSISTTPLSIWCIADSIYYLQKNEPLPMDSTVNHELASLGFTTETITYLTNQTAITDKLVYYLADPTHILIVR